MGREKMTDPDRAVMVAKCGCELESYSDKGEWFIRKLCSAHASEYYGVNNKAREILNTLRKELKVLAKVQRARRAGKRIMTRYNTGYNIITKPEEGIAIHQGDKTMFLTKIEAVRLADLVKEARKYWKRFKLKPMVIQA
jgi:uncharacterized protein with von Willebrand factor type A (vWA) domain